MQLPNVGVTSKTTNRAINIVIVCLAAALDMLAAASEGYRVSVDPTTEHHVRSRIPLDPRTKIGIAGFKILTDLTTKLT